MNDKLDEILDLLRSQNEMIKDIKWLEMIAFSSIIGMSSFD